jgi:alkanesulfonate monooxygenase
MPNSQIEVFSTCPQFRIEEADHFLWRVAEVARWSEAYGCKGILVYSDNSQLDPWLVSQLIIARTESLCPLVAVQPAYMHPYSVAKMVSYFGVLYGRRLYLNMVAGGFKNDLMALNDATPHDKRYTRLSEYTTIIKRLLSSSAPVSFEGEFYRIDQLKMVPNLPPELFPGIFISGSSEAGFAAAQATGATAIEYPKPAAQCEARLRREGVTAGIRVGIIARQNEGEAWQVAYSRFPEDRKGALTHQLAMKTSDSVWHKTLSALGAQRHQGNNTYWLRPFETYKSFCPYLVGSYDRVAEELANYIRTGYSTFILDIPPTEEELRHIKAVFGRSSRKSEGRFLNPVSNMPGCKS